MEQLRNLTAKKNKPVTIDLNKSITGGRKITLTKKQKPLNIKNLRDIPDISNIYRLVKGEQNVPESMLYRGKYFGK